MSALVLLHGFTGSPASFDGVLAALASQGDLADPGLAVLRPALLGHDPAGAPRPRPARFEDEVARLALLLPAGDDLHLCGYSLGARLALGLLCHEPTRFASATLLSVNPGLASAAAREERAAADAAWEGLLQGAGLDAFLDAWEAQPLFASQARLPAAARAAQRARRAQHQAQGLALALRVLGLGRMPDYGLWLPQLDLPVHLMVGALDQKFVDLSRAAAPRLRQGSVTVVPGVGHDLLLEAPQAVAAALGAALRAPPRAAYFT